MEVIQLLQGVDIYLIDQLMKGRVEKEGSILDAGCGSGRNFLPFLSQGYRIEAFDIDESKIQFLKQQIKPSDLATISSIEHFSSEHRYDFIICNAVLHFATSHEHFEAMFKNLALLLEKDGVLFIRMTSDIGQNNHIDIGNGRFLLPDGTERYLVSRRKIDELCVVFDLALIEPVKSLNVDGQRVMTTIVMSRN